ncbi:MAG: hypothetical protein U0Q03_16750 [Acidimicrobiales bacterium]
MNVVTDRLVIRSYHGAPFEIHGTLDDVAVAVETVDDSLVVSERLLVRAQELVVEHAIFSLPDYDLSYLATVEGDGPAVALTMLRSFDRVTSMRFQVWRS